VAFSGVEPVEPADSVFGDTPERTGFLERVPGARNSHQDGGSLQSIEDVGVPGPCGLLVGADDEQRRGGDFRYRGAREPDQRTAYRHGEGPARPVRRREEHGSSTRTRSCEDGAMGPGDALALRPFAHTGKPRSRALDMGVTQVIQPVRMLFLAREQVDTERRISGKTESTSEVALDVAVAAGPAAAAQNHEATHAACALPTCR